MNSAEPLEGMVVAIAGAGGGLGGAVAERLAADGASLALADIAVSRVEPLAAALVDSGVAPERIHLAGVDLLDESAAGRWRDEVVERLGRVDGLLHLVGGWRGGDPIQSFEMADYEFLHDLLVRTLQVATRAFHEPISRSQRGRFAIVSSTQARAPEGTNAAYAATKAAAESWMLALAESLKGSAATANVVVVNAILTAAMRAEDPGGDFSGLTADTDIAAALAYVCSDAAGSMNGQRIELHR